MITKDDLSKVTIVAKEKRLKKEGKDFYPLVKESGEWKPGNPTKECLKRKLCLYESGSDIRLYIEGMCVMFKNVFCPGDRIWFMKQVNKICDQWTHSGQINASFYNPKYDNRGEVPAYH